MTDPDGRHALSFGTAADSYDTYRPGYADAAVRWAIGEQPVRVADIGAGTGILSRQLQRLGHEVIAVEPDDLMRERLRTVSPGIAALAGSAEEIPLPDESVEAVVAGQAYHWFDPAKAHPEIARVLRPGGVFAALWNDADPRAPWTVRLVEIIDGPHAAVGSRGESDFGICFAAVEAAEFRHEMWLTPDDLIGLATTRSPYLVGTPEQRRDMVAAIRALVAETGLADRERFSMPHVTRAHRAARLRPPSAAAACVPGQTRLG
jgi:SAM-dependent methyltransferase